MDGTEPLFPGQTLWAVIDGKRIDDGIEILKTLVKLYPNAAKFVPKDKEAKIWSMIIDFGKNSYLKAFEDIFKMQKDNAAINAQYTQEQFDYLTNEALPGLEALTGQLDGHIDGEPFICKGNQPTLADFYLFPVFRLWDVIDRKC